MQTFLPYPTFARSARVLDTRRLGKQRSEALTVLRVLGIPTYGWQHHPAVAMWRGFDTALLAYGLAVCDEWTARGHRDSVTGTLLDLAGGLRPGSQGELRAAGLLPPWLGRRAFHRSHQSALLRKDPAWYRRYFPRVPDDLPYVWPV